MNWYKKSQNQKLTRKNYEDVERAIKSMPNYQEYMNEIVGAARDYDMYESDSFRHDFCGTNCTCDRDYLDGLIERVKNKFPNVPDLIIENNIWDARS